MKTKKVLIVDYNDVNRHLMESLIAQLYTVESVKYGHQALDKASHTNFDLILLDIQMPDMDGISIAKGIWAKSIYQHPIIAISAYSAESARQCFREIGFIDLINKPIRPKDFLERITEYFNSLKEGDDKVKANSSVLDKDIVHQLSKFNPAKNLRSLYIGFLEEFDQLMGEIETAYKIKNQQTLIEKLHTIKGNSGSLGADTIFEVSTEADRLTRAGDWNSLGKTLTELKNEREIFEKYLEEDTTFNL